MKPYVLLAMILLSIVAFAACVRKPAQTQEGSITVDAAVQRQIAEDSLAFLRTRIDNSASFSDITDAFAALCTEPTVGEELLFEACTTTFDGKSMFTVSLARQIPNGEDEFFQIRVELSYPPNKQNEKITETEWINPTAEDAFDAVRQSAAFAYADTHAAVSVDLYISET